MASLAFDTLTGRMPEPTRPSFLLGDIVRLGRPHPCGGQTWLVDRLGADLGLRCQTCGRHILLSRATVEQRLVGFVSHGDPALTVAVDPFSAGELA
jgi:hypothetical protein